MKFYLKKTCGILLLLLTFNSTLSYAQPLNRLITDIEEKQVQARETAQFFLERNEELISVYNQAAEEQLTGEYRVAAILSVGAAVLLRTSVSSQSLTTGLTSLGAADLAIVEFSTRIAAFTGFLVGFGESLRFVDEANDNLDQLTQAILALESGREFQGEIPEIELNSIQERSLQLEEILVETLIKINEHETLRLEEIYEASSIISRWKFSYALEVNQEQIAANYIRAEVYSQYASLLYNTLVTLRTYEELQH